MKKFVVALMGILFLATFTIPAIAETINDADTNLRQTLKFALIGSLREPVNQAIDEIFKDDKNAPEGLTWASYDTKILKIRQVHGMGGLYEITLKVFPYYSAHNSYGEDEVVINTEGELVNFRHLKTYPMENALFEFFYSTGCRIGEVARLNRDDINFEGNSVIVHGKGDKEREVYFNIRCGIWLNRYLDERDDDASCLFVTKRSPRRRMSIDTLRYIVKRISNGAGIKKNDSSPSVASQLCYTHGRQRSTSRGHSKPSRS